jgi:uncharacterized protein HemX
MSKKKIFIAVLIAVIISITIVGASVTYVMMKNRNSAGDTVNFKNQRGSAADQLSDQQKAELEKDLNALEQKIKSQPDNAQTRAEQTLEIQEIIKKYNLR